MGFHPFEVNPPHLIYTGLGAFVVIFGMISLFIKEKLYLGEAVIATVFGIIVGPYCLNLFNPSDWAGTHSEPPGDERTNEITLEVMRITIALSVFAVAVELPKAYVLKHWRSLFMVLGPVMIYGWFVSAALMYAIIPGLTFLNSLVVAACTTPTDPILAQAVVGGPWAEKHVPAHIRHLLQAESSCNDGAAFPFLFIALYLTTQPHHEGHAVGEWFYVVWAYDIVLGIVIGAVLGYAARKFIRYSEKHRLVDRESFVAQYVSLAVLSIGICTLLGSDDLLSAFACGTAFAWDGWFTKQTEDSNFSNVVDLLFNCAAFIYIGATIPFHTFNDATLTLSPWRLVVLGICIIFLRRLPIMVALWKVIPDVKTFREACFSGHFGPIGVGGVFIATLGRQYLGDRAYPPTDPLDVLAGTIQPIVFFLVLCSVVIHGLTIPFFAFTKRAHTITHTLSISNTFSRTSFSRTWSRAPTDNEPTWLSRVTRVHAGEEIIVNKDEEIGSGSGSGSGSGTGSDSRTRETAVADDEEEEEGQTSLERGDEAGRELERAKRARDAAAKAEEIDLEKAERVAPAKGVGIGVVGARPVPIAKPRHRRPVQDYDDIEDFNELGGEYDDPSGDWGDSNAKERATALALYEEAVRAKREKEKAKEAEEEVSSSSSDRAPAVHPDHLTKGEEAPTTAASDATEAASSEPHHGPLSWFMEKPPDEELGPMDRDVRRELSPPPADEDELQRRLKEVNEVPELDTSGESRPEPRPIRRQWVEGHHLLTEYQESPGDDVEVRVIDLRPEEAEGLREKENPAWEWVQRHVAELEQQFGRKFGEHEKWTAERVLSKLASHDIGRVLERRHEKGKRRPEKGKRPEVNKGGKGVKEEEAEDEAGPSSTWGAASVAGAESDMFETSDEELAERRRSPKARSPRSGRGRVALSRSSGGRSPSSPNYRSGSRSPQSLSSSKGNSSTGSGSRRSHAVKSDTPPDKRRRGNSIRRRLLDGALGLPGRRDARPSSRSSREDSGESGDDKDGDGRSSNVGGRARLASGSLGGHQRSGSESRPSSRPASIRFVDSGAESGTEERPAPSPTTSEAFRRPPNRRTSSASSLSHVVHRRPGSASSSLGPSSNLGPAPLSPVTEVQGKGQGLGQDREQGRNEPTPPDVQAFRPSTEKQAAQGGDGGSLEQDDRASASGGILQPPSLTGTGGSTGEKVSFALPDSKS